MIKQMTLAMALLAASTIANANMAQANPDDNVITLLAETNQEGNSLDLIITGDSNSLVLEQSNATGFGAGNLMEITIIGDNNGGAVGGQFTGVALNSGLEPGHLQQTGWDNAMHVDIQGSNNLFAALQSGNGNSLTATIEGYDNQAAILQVGQNNHASISQTGMGNAISISQRSF